MKKLRYLLLCGLLTLYIPKVYALNFNIRTAGDVVVNSGEKIEIAVGIDNITGTNDGISVCSMNILLDKNVELEANVRTLNSWTMTTGGVYLFDTGSPVLNKSDIFIMPIIVRGEGSITLNNILCSDGVEEVSVSDKKINFSIKKEENKNEVNGNNNSNNSDNNNKPSSGSGNNNVTENDKTNQDDSDNIKSNCNLSIIELSEGSIEFDPNVTEYEVKIKDFKNFKVTPKLENPESSSYVIDKNYTTDGGNVIITVNGSGGDIKIYTIYTIVEDVNDVELQPKNNNYVPIFVVIIVALIIINLIRIIIKVSKKKEQKVSVE